MKDRELDALGRKYLLARMPGFAARHALVFQSPIEYLLRGFCYQKSQFDPQDFYVAVFIQPLFVPDDCVVISLGDRLRTRPGGPDERWTLQEDTEEAVMEDVHEKICQQGLPFLAKFTTLRDIADRSVAHNKNRYDLYAPEMAAYSAILIDDAETAIKMFDCAETRFEGDDDRRGWVIALMDRIRMVRKTYERNQTDAITLLKQWRIETARNLSLEEFLGPILD